MAVFRWFLPLILVVFLVFAGPQRSVLCAAESHEGHGEETSVAEAVNPLDFKADLALWTAVVFVGVLVVLRAFAWKPLAEALDQRENHVRQEIQEAENAKVEAKQILAEYQQKMAAVEGEVRAILDRARKEAQEISEELIAKARQEAEAEYQRKMAEIEQATDRAVKELTQRSATLAVEMAGKIISARLDPAAHQRIIEQAMGSIAQMKPPGLN
jgi:F-type H+-transporting ATPase subunit b